MPTSGSTTALSTEHSLHGDSRRRALVLQKIEGYQLDAVNVPAGQRDVQVRVQSPGDRYDEKKL
jgi:hypothetical protein